MSSVMPLPSDHEITREVDAIVHSPLFTRSPNLCRILKWTILSTLAGKGTDIKEKSIAMACLWRKNDFDPRLDSVVRVYMRRLREGLREYYAGPGYDDMVEIVFTVGSYIPRFIYRHVAPVDPSDVLSSPLVLPYCPGCTLLSTEVSRLRSELGKRNENGNESVLNVHLKSTSSPPQVIDSKGDR